MRFVCLFLASSVYFLVSASNARAELPGIITRDPTAFSRDLLEKFFSESEGRMKGLASLFEDPAEWRYYTRDGGTLIAISLNKNLILTERTAAEKSLQNVAERLINQGGGAADVRVVFIEPADRATHAAKPTLLVPSFVFPVISPCCNN